MIRPCTFGIEEEYLLVNLGSGQVPATPSPAVMGRCREALGRYFAQEMFRSQIELASPVFTNLYEAREFLQRNRQRLRVALAEEGMGPYAAASHPCAAWLLQKPAAQGHYKQLFDDYRHVARRSLLNGLHVHVGVPPACDRMQLINRLLPWLPLLLALSTSSPLWAGQPTGYLSYRRVICGEWPHMGLPKHCPTGPPMSATVPCCSEPVHWLPMATFGGHSGLRGAIRQWSCASAMAARIWKTFCALQHCFATWLNTALPTAMTRYPAAANCAGSPRRTTGVPCAMGATHNS